MILAILCICTQGGAVLASPLESNSGADSHDLISGISSNLNIYKSNSLFNQSLESLNKRRLNDSLRYLEKALILNPKNGNAWYYKGVVLGERGLDKEAWEAFNRSNETSPMDEKSYTERGIELMNRDLDSMALGFLDKAIARNSSYPDAWYNKGLVLGKMGKTDEARACFYEIFNITGGESERNWTSLGSAVAERSMNELAYQCYIKALEINNSCDEAWLEMAFTMISLDRIDEAMNCIFEADRIRALDESTWNLAGKKLTESWNEWEAVKCFENATRINATFAEGWYNEGVALGKLGKFDAAMEAFRNYNRSAKLDEIGWTQAGKELGRQGFDGSAYLFFMEATKINKSYADGWYYKGIAQMEMGDYAGAVESLNNSQSLVRDEAYGIKIATKLGICYGNLGSLDKSLYYFARAVDKEPFNPLHHYNMGITLAKMGRHEDALYCFDRVLKIKPDYRGASYNRGLALLKIKRYGEALDSFEKALSLSGESANAWYNKGLALADIGRNESLLAFDKALEYSNSNADRLSILYSKGLFLAKSERFNESLQCYNKTLDIYESYEPGWIGKGELFMKVGREVDALVCFNRALEISAKHQSEAWYEKGRAQYILCNALRRSGQELDASAMREACLRSFNESLSLDPGFDDARAMSEMVEEDSDDTYGQDFPGIYRTKSNDFDILAKGQKIKSLEEDLSRYRQNETIALERKGDALLKLGSSYEAMIAYNEARDLDSDKFIAFMFFVILMASALLFYEMYTQKPISLGSRKEISTSYVLHSVNILSFLAFFWILLYYFDTSKLKLMAGSSIAIAIAAALIWVIFTSSAHKEQSLRKELKFALWEFENKNRFYNKWIIGLFSSAFIFLITIIIYSHNSFLHRYIVFHHDLALDAIRIVLTILLMMSLVVTVPPIGFLINKRDIDKDVRNIVCIFAVFYLILWTGFLKGIIWTYSDLIDILEGLIPFRIEIFNASFIVLSLIILLSFLHGSRKGKSRREDLLRDQHKMIETLSKSLKSIEPPQYERELKALADECCKNRQDFINEIDDVKSEDRMQIEGEKFVESNLVKKLRETYSMDKDPVEDIITRFRFVDPRIGNLCFLEHLKTDLCEIVGKIKTGDENEKKNLVERFSEQYQGILERIKEAIAEESKARPQLLVILITILTPILLQFIVYILAATIGASFASGDLSQLASESLYQAAGYN